MTDTKLLLVAVAIALAISTSLQALVAQHPSLAPLYAALIGAFVGAGVADLLDEDHEAMLQRHLLVATAVTCQTIQRLDDDQRRRAIADAERELMAECGIDVEIDGERMAAEVPDLEASDD